MQKLRNWFTNFPPVKRRVFVTIGLTTLAFVVFSLATIGDLLSSKNIQELIVNPVPIAISIVGFLAVLFVLRDRIRAASYLLIAAVSVGFLLIAIFAAKPTYSTVVELLIVVIPVMIALQSFSERELIWVVIFSIIARSAIQILGTLKIITPLSGVSAQTAQVAQWIAIIVAILFSLYIALNLNNYIFRIKMVLVLGLLTIIPTSILTVVSSQDLESNLISQANNSLVLSSGQLASAVDQYLQTTLDATRTEAQISTLEDYVDQPGVGLSGGSRIFAHGTDLEKTTTNALLAFIKRDPFNIISCRLFDNHGVLQLSTNQIEIGQLGITQNYFILPFLNGVPYVSPVMVSDTGVGIMHFSAPIRTSAGITNGVIDIVYSASVLQQVMIRNSNKLGPDVNAMLLDENKIILAHSLTPDLIYKIINPPDTNTVSSLIYTNQLQNLPITELSVQMGGLTPGLANTSSAQYFTGNLQTQPSQGYKGYIASPVVDQAGVAKLTSRNWYIVTFVPQNTLLAPVQKQTQSVVLISILIALLSIAVALGLTQVLIAPIQRLTRTAEQITQGDINAMAKVTSHDEIGVLANAFNAMTGRIRDLIGNLEQRVAERTQALEKRAVQLQAAADVGSSAARLRDLSELLREVTRLISQRFGFYHVGIFLLDDRGEYAVLRASNSEGGQLMLNRGHKLKVGQVGIVGYVTGTGQPRIALNVGEDKQFFSNPDLPTTQSEMALPLIAGERILGALDIQSTQESAFTQDDIATLKVLADQIAIAIENARLFLENRAALETAQRAYGTLSAEGWRRLFHEGLESVGYVSFSENQVSPVSESASPGFLQALQSGQHVLENSETVLNLPIKIRGQSIGAIRMERSEGSGPWTPDTLGMADALSIQLGAALESARLFEETTRRADREKTVSEITTRIRSTTDPAVMLKTALDELKLALGAKDIKIRSYTTPSDIQDDRQPASKPAKPAETA